MKWKCVLKIYLSHLLLKSNTEVSLSSLVPIVNQPLKTTGVLLPLALLKKNVSDTILLLLY